MFSAVGRTNTIAFMCRIISRRASSTARNRGVMWQTKRTRQQYAVENSCKTIDEGRGFKGLYCRDDRRARRCKEASMVIHWCFAICVSLK